MSELKACPWCGQQPRTGGDFGNFYVACDNLYSESECHAGPTVIGETVQEAAEKWNTRADGCEIQKSELPEAPK